MAKGQKRRWPPGLYEYIIERDRGCVAPRLGLGGERQCFGRIEIDHVRPSYGLGLKSATEAWNLVSLCGQHHYMKTINANKWRPGLIRYLNRVEEREGDTG